jgi:hypothetical protein
LCKERNHLITKDLKNKWNIKILLELLQITNDENIVHKIDNEKGVYIEFKSQILRIIRRLYLDKAP